MKKMRKKDRNYCDYEASHFTEPLSVPREKKEIDYLNFYSGTKKQLKIAKLMTFDPAADILCFQFKEKKRMCLKKTSRTADPRKCVIRNSLSNFDSQNSFCGPSKTNTET